MLNPPEPCQYSNEIAKQIKRVASAHEVATYFQQRAAKKTSTDAEEPKATVENKFLRLKFDGEYDNGDP